jgi:hypothetical protein
MSLRRVIVAFGWIGWVTGFAAAGPTGLPDLSAESKQCIECHKASAAGIFQQWGTCRARTSRGRNYT